MRWDPEQYLKSGFDDLRLRPGLDLLAAISHPDPRRIIDLGCGTGTLTALLAARWPEATVTGLDRSVEMLAKAGENAPGISLVEADVTTWIPDATSDVIYSNAMLQWLDDHQTMFPRLLSMLNTGGVLAVQMPRNHQAPSHTAMTDAALAGPWRDKLEPLLRPSPVAAPEVYYDVLSGLCTGLSIWETEYLQVLEGEDPVKEWTKGTALRPLLAALEGEEAEAFEQDYAARLRPAYPRRSDGKTLFPFRRLFLLAVK